MSAGERRGNRERDARTGRPVEAGLPVPPERLSEAELDEELLIAAAATGRMRFGRYQTLAREWQRRRTWQTGWQQPEPVGD
jgi:hypothetical protein